MALTTYADGNGANFRAGAAALYSFSPFRTKNARSGVRGEREKVLVYGPPPRKKGRQSSGINRKSGVVKCLLLLRSRSCRD